MIKEIDSLSLKQAMDSGVPILLLDVREDFELRLASIDGAVHIPLGQLQSRVDELEDVKRVVVFCHHGVRSLTGGYILEQAGIEDVASLAGGIDAWSTQVDVSVARY